MKKFKFTDLNSAAAFAGELEALPLGGVVLVEGSVANLKRASAGWREASIRRGFRLSIKSGELGVLVTKCSPEPRYRKPKTDELARRSGIIEALVSGAPLREAARRYGISHQRVAVIAQTARVRLPKLNRQAVHQFLAPYLQTMGPDRCILCGSSGTELKNSLCKSCRRFLAKAREGKSALRRYGTNPSDGNAQVAASLLRRAGLSPNELRHL